MTTDIEWVRNPDGSKGETWNPTTGCTPVSEGCDHCYAKRIYERFHGKGSFEKVELHPERLDAPLHWRNPRRVFVNSMSDLFHDSVCIDFVAKVFAVMAMVPQHTFQVLTKRPGRMASMLREEWLAPHVASAMFWLRKYEAPGELPWPPPNVWLGVSVENQKWADVRIPKLLETPAAVRFLSCEPLLGPVDLDNEEWLPPWGDGQGRAIDWAIVGGESGPGARPMHPDWVRSLRDQCVAARVPFFFKGWGEWARQEEGGVRPLDICMSEDGDTFEVDESYICAPNESDGSWLRRIGKKRAGRELDGRTWDEYPKGAA